MLTQTQYKEVVDQVFSSYTRWKENGMNIQKFDLLSLFNSCLNRAIKIYYKSNYRVAAIVFRNYKDRMFITFFEEDYGLVIKADITYALGDQTGVEQAYALRDLINDYDYPKIELKTASNINTVSNTINFSLDSLISIKF